MVDGARQPEQAAKPELWGSMLREAMRKNRLPDSTMVMVGHTGCGKSTLLNRFQGSSAPHPVSTTLDSGAAADSSPNTQVEAGAGGAAAQAEPFHPMLAYTYFDAVDPSESDVEKEDSPPRVGVWCCSQPEFRDLLGTVLTPPMLLHTVAVVALDMETPWAIMDQLEQWVQALEALLSSLAKRLSPGEQDDLRLRASVPSAAAAASLEDTDRAPPSASSGPVLGVPLVVCCCKADLVQRETYEQQQVSQFIQQKLRSFCLRYGATLVYTSAKTGSNVALLQRYILHRLYPATFSSAQEGVVSEQVFIPSGWDSEALISSLLPRDTKLELGPGSSYHEVVRPPPAARGGAGPDDDDLVTLGPEADWLAELRKEMPTPPPALPHVQSARVMRQTFAGSTQRSFATEAERKKEADKKKAQPTVSTDPRDFFSNLLHDGGSVRTSPTNRK